MNTGTGQLPAKKHNWGIIGAVATAIAASACCIGPFVLLLLGVSGAWIGGLTLLEPFRPYLTALTLGLLGVAFYRVYRTPKEECTPGSACAIPKSRRRNKIVLWVMSVLVLGLLISPYVLPRVYAERDAVAVSNSRNVTLTVENMTCDACAVTIRTGLMRLDGVASAQATLRPPRAEVAYDPSVLSVEDLIEATTNLGYPSHVEPGTQDK